MNANSIIRKLLPQNPAIRTMVQHGILTVFLYVFLGVIAWKYLSEFPLGVLLFLYAASLGLGILHIWAIRRYPWVVEDSLKAIGFTISLTAVAISTLFITLDSSSFVNELAITPILGMSVFFVEHVLREWENTPPYIPPLVTLENYADVMGLKVFEKSTSFIRFALCTHSIEKSDDELPSNIGWSVAPTPAFNVPLKDLFAAFLLYNNYNERGAAQIKVSDDSALEAQPYHWAFYTKYWGFWKRYLLPEKSLHANQITLHRSWWVIEGRVQFIRKKTIYAIRFKSNTL